MNLIKLCGGRGFTVIVVLLIKNSFYKPVNLHYIKKEAVFIVISFFLKIYYKNSYELNTQFLDSQTLTIVFLFIGNNYFSIFCFFIYHFIKKKIFFENILCLLKFFKS